LGTHSLICHPETPARRVKDVSVTVDVTSGRNALFGYAICPADTLALPGRAPPRRKDGLWQTTCCELFLRAEGADAYCEFNFSPSGEWAAYNFEAYREGVSACAVDVEPHIECSVHDGALVLEADVAFGGLEADVLTMALCAVIEEVDGTKSYWALAHPPGKPDFHHPACFALSLPAPGKL
jgi:hypothetical protein